jgi:hypothetical protein
MAGIWSKCKQRTCATANIPGSPGATTEIQSQAPVITVTARKMKPKVCSFQEVYMADTFEIKSYQLYTFSSRDKSIANTVVLFNGANGYLGGAFFSNDSVAPLQPAIKYPNGNVGLFYRMSDLPFIIDMLRNEKPVYLIFDGVINSRISTSTEPVGEGEDIVARMAELVHT